jgi:hypothetical protein
MDRPRDRSKHSANDVVCGWEFVCGNDENTKETIFTLHLHLFSYKCFINNKAGKEGINVTLRSFHITIVAAEKK